MANSSFVTGLSYAFDMNETSGTRASSIVSYNATETGGSVGYTTGVNSNASSYTAAQATYLTVSDSSTVRLGKRDWTFDGYSTLNNTNQYHGLIEKGSELRVYWAPSGAQNHIQVDFDNGGATLTLAIQPSGSYWRVWHDWSNHVVGLQVGATITTASYTWANNAGTSDILMGLSSYFGAYWDGYIDDTCMWTKVLSTSEVYMRQNQLKFISSFTTNPPYIYYSDWQNWSHFPKSESYTNTPGNYGGSASAGGWSVNTGTLPTGLSIDSNTGVISGTPTTLGTSDVVIRATNSDGNSDYTIKLVVVQHYPVAGLTFIPYQKFDSAGYVGCDAVCRNGINYVSFSFNGGAATQVNTVTFNSATGVYEYKCPFDPANYSDGAVTVDVTVVPLAGDSRVFATRSILANHGGTLTHTPIYISSTGNDSTGNGTSGNPYLTILKACQVLQSNYSDCGNCTIYLANGDYKFGWDTSDTISTSTGWITLEAAPGSTPRSVRFTSNGTNSLKGADKIKIRNIDGYQLDLTAPTGTPQIWANGNCVFTGGGIISEAYQFISQGTWTGGIWIDGDPVNYSALSHGDVASYLTAALDKHVVFQDSAVFPFNTQIKRNMYALNTSKDCTVSGDKYLANIITDTIDATGSSPLFHSDVQHLSGFGGDINLYVHGLLALRAEAQSFFSRNGAEDPNDPDLNIAFVNYSARKDYSGFNADWSKSTSNILWINCDLPNENMQIRKNDADNDNHMSYVTVKNCVFAAHNFSKIGADSPDVDCNHIADSAYGTNCTTGGTETDWWTAPSTDDYSVVNGSDIKGVSLELLTPSDVLNKARSLPGAIGAFAASNEGIVSNSTISGFSSISGISTISI